MKRIWQDFLTDFYEKYIQWGIIFGIMGALSYVLFYYTLHPVFFYNDTDCYMRAIRIVDWLENFQWSEKLFPYSNPPDGFVLHFTRINDVIWTLFSLPFMPFMPLKEAVYNGGFFFSPLFLILTYVSVLWGCYPFFRDIKMKNKTGIFFLNAMLSLFFLAKLNSVFEFIRPDHHSLMCAVFAFNFAVIMRCLGKENCRQMFWSGVVSALGIWASSAIEGLVILSLILAVNCFNWLWGKWSIKSLIFYAMGVFLTTTAAWLINPPYGGYEVMDINRLSLVQVALTALILLSFVCLWRLNDKSWQLKIVALSTVAVVSALTMILLFGTETLFTSIYDPQVKEYFVSRINEMSSVLGYRFFYPSILIGLLMMIYLLVITKCRQLCVLNITFLSLSILIIGGALIRFFPYYLVAICFLTAAFIIFAHQHMQKKYQICCFIFFLLNFSYMVSFSSYPDRVEIPHLKGTTLTHLFDAPYLIFYQGVDTVGSPYHSNVEGIIDNHRMFFTSDEEELKALLKKHKVEYIYLHSHEFSYYKNSEENTDKLYGKIMSGKNLYPWMEMESSSGIYKVNYDKF